MTHIGVTVFNIRDGGRLPNGGYDFSPAVEAIAARPAYLDLIVLCEGKEYAWHGGAGMYGMAGALTGATGLPFVPLLGTCERGEFGPMLLANTASLTVERWHGYGVPHVPEDRRNYAEIRTRADGVRFGVLPQHWDYQSCERRLAEAKLISWVAGQSIPILVAGDFNSTSSGPHEPWRDFRQQPPHKRHHKGRLVSAAPRRWLSPRAQRTSQWAPATEALDFLLGWWDVRRGCRVDGVGLYDVAEVAFFDYAEPGVVVPTVNAGTDAGGGLRIDRGLTNELGRHTLVPGSFRVDDCDPSTSDHKLVRFVLGL